jgi:hypothetical protein
MIDEETKSQLDQNSRGDSQLIQTAVTGGKNLISSQAIDELERQTRGFI